MKLLTVIVLILCSSCVKGVSDSVDSKYLHTVTIDGCEYLYYDHPWYFTHKGNCSNQIHKCK